MQVYYIKTYRQVENVYCFFFSESTQTGVPHFETNVVAQFDDHYCTVWRVSWNCMGTILASSGDDGCVRLWKDNFINHWKCISVLKGDGIPAQGAETPVVATPPSSSTPAQQIPSTTRYYKLGTISHPNQVPWH